MACVGRLFPCPLGQKQPVSTTLSSSLHTITHHYLVTKVSNIVSLHIKHNDFELQIGNLTDLKSHELRHRKQCCQSENQHNFHRNSEWQNEKFVSILSIRVLHCLETQWFRPCKTKKWISIVWREWSFCVIYTDSLFTATRTSLEAAASGGTFMHVRAPINVGLDEGSSGSDPIISVWLMKENCYRLNGHWLSYQIKPWENLALPFRLPLVTIISHQSFLQRAAHGHGVLHWSTFYGVLWVNA